MPSDARSLLKAANKERNKAAAPSITDPLASYNSASGALRCSACNYLAIKHESLWAAHIVSKTHRANAARIHRDQALKQEQDDLTRQSQAQQIKDGKRKAVDNDDTTSIGNADSGADTYVAKRARNTEIAEADSEWEQFKRQMEASEGTFDADRDHRYGTDTTIEVQPQLHANVNDPSPDADHEATQEEIAARERARQEREEREEILSRYEEEQRLQDEADERVRVLKNRLERIRQARKQKSMKS